MAIAFTIDKDAVARLLGEPPARSHLMTVANRILQGAEERTPVLSGETRSALFVAEGPEDEHGSPTAIVGSNSPIWHLIEFGSIHNGPSRPLTGATEAVVQFIPSAK